MTSSSSRYSGSARPAEISAERGTRLAPPRATAPTFGKLARRLGLLLLIAVGCACLLLELDLHFLDPGNTTDFLAFYTAGTILRQGARRRLYDVPLQKSIQVGLQPRHLRMPFYHPPFEAWLFAPLARFSLLHAFLLWSLVNLILLGLVFYLLRYTGCRLDQDRRIVWLVASLPAAAGVLVKGQDGLLLAVVFILAFLALKHRRDVAAGLALGAGLFHFEVVLPFVFIFFLRRRWKLLAGFAAAAAVAAGISLLSVGWNGMLQYAGVIVQAGRARGSMMGGGVTAMPTLHGALATLFGWAIPDRWLFPLVLFLTLLLLGWAAWEFTSVGRPECGAFDLQFSLAALAAVMASYHLYVYLLTPLILVAFLILGREATAPAHRFVDVRAATILLLLLGLVPIVGTLLRFYDFSVLFIVILGLAVWCAQETVRLERDAA